jgi:general secretion pathway protein E/type IV pilus assembly protein PilB
MEYTKAHELSTELKQVLTTAQSWYFQVIPAKIIENVIYLYSSEKNNSDSVSSELEVMLGTEVQLTTVPQEWIIENLTRYYPNAHQNHKTELLNTKSQDLLSLMLEEASRIKSSDIHIEAFEERCRVRFRIDGKLVERYIVPSAEYPALINKIKIKSFLDISEKRLPQDGRIIYDQGGYKFDIRVSILPTLHGEKVVMRLLNRDATQLQLDYLGFTCDQLNDYMEGVKNPNGVILISGPTGSGKTTTLYATLKLLNKNETNILTIEDPIEYTLEGINQVQLKESIGLTFANALRTFLRQDPDIIMVGEIRDTETAQMAIRAALTGHLVLSTVHTNSAWGTITRLIDMGIPSYLIASTLKLSAAQRLVRLLCPKCKKEETFSSDEFPKVFVAPFIPETHFIPVGCQECYFTGYRGRRALYEIITVDETLKEQIRTNQLDASTYFSEKGIETISHQAFKVFTDGDTSLIEVYSLFNL